jgi:predicted MarR family transcription regulator
MVKSKTNEAVAIDSEQLSEMELALTVLWNSVRRWMNQRSKAGEVSGLSDLDVFVLHLLVYRNRPLRVSDLAFALSIDDMHQVVYSLKKLVRSDMITSAKSGKEVFYSAGEKGRRHYDEFIRDREKYLEPSMKLVTQGEHNIESLISFLRTLSGIYEQAARSAASSRGL